MHQLLARLEHYDSFPAADALRAALADVAASQSSSDAVETAARLLWEGWQSTDEGARAWQALVAWADDRLAAWHSLKVNAVDAAWREDPSGDDLRAMQRAVIVSLRQGLADHPELVPDAQLMQALAHAGHPFAFTQALRELRAEGLNLPDADIALKRHCALCANAFKWLLA